MRILWIPDAHARPGENLRRFTHLGRMVASLRPEAIVCVGDWWDLPAFSRYDKGRRSAEGRRWAADRDAGFKAMDLFVEPWAGAAKYRPEMVFTHGNHEARADEVAESSPELHGAVGTAQLEVERWGWTAHKFGEIVDVHGYAVSHYLPNGIMGRPISGVMLARSLVLKSLCSAVQGHSHLAGAHTETDVLGRKLQGLSLGCYIDPSDPPDGWNRQTKRLWASGCFLTHHLAPGYGDPEWWGFERIAKQFRRA